MRAPTLSAGRQARPFRLARRLRGFAREHRTKDRQRLIKLAVRGQRDRAPKRDLDNVRRVLFGRRVLPVGDRESARRLLEAKDEFRDLEFNNSKRHLARLRAGQAASIETSAIHMDIMRDLKQINSHLASVAYPILHSSGELLDSRLKAFEEELDAEARVD